MRINLAGLSIWRLTELPGRPFEGLTDICLLTSVYCAVPVRLRPLDLMHVQGPPPAVFGECMV
jgi:hypothetical protein